MKNEKIEKSKITKKDTEEKTSIEESKLKKMIKELVPYAVILIVVVLIRTYLVTPIMVNGPSMQPTLKGGEIMILNKIPKTFKRFEVVVVDIGKEDIIKRVIALPGETITCEGGIVYINDRRQDEEFSQGFTSDFAPIKLGEDEYFVMGDNREDSLDSRAFGPFKSEQIKGTTSLVLFPFNKIGNIE